MMPYVDGKWVDEQPKEEGSAMRSFLDAMSAPGVARKVMPRNTPEVHMGFSRGGAPTIHDLGKSKLARIHDQFIMGKSYAKDDVDKWIEDRIEVDSPESLAKEIAMYSSLSYSEAKKRVAEFMQKKGYVLDKDVFGAPEIRRR